MPWKGEKDPYLIWLSEIILQQTRVEQGLPYFLRFKEKYPRVNHLAAAPEDEVMKLWQGLGYYSRARNLHGTAKYITGHLNGAFPSTFLELKQLKGVGDYTAAAIASFAFGEKKAVVDGNVIRVLSRVFGTATPFDTMAGKKEFAALAQQLISEHQPAVYNQAIMDFGATICTPQNPICGQCPFNKKCVALLQNRIPELPVRSKKIKIGHRYFTYLLVADSRHLLIQKRESNDIWKGLYQLPLIETAKPLKSNFTKAIQSALGTGGFAVGRYTTGQVQLLTHRKIHFTFIEVTPHNFAALTPASTLKVKKKDLGNYAFPKTIHLYLQQNLLI